MKIYATERRMQAVKGTYTRLVVAALTDDRVPKPVTVRSLFDRAMPGRKPDAHDPVARSGYVAIAQALRKYGVRTPDGYTGVKL